MRVVSIHGTCINSGMKCSAVSGCVGNSHCAHTSALPAEAAAGKGLAVPRHGCLLRPVVCFRTAGTTLSLPPPPPPAPSASEAAATPCSAASTASAASESSSEASPDAASLSVTEPLSAPVTSSAEPAQAAQTHQTQHLSTAELSGRHLRALHRPIKSGTRGKNI
jgi:hypothetical protein